MFTIYDGNSLIIAFRKNLFSTTLKEEELLSRKVETYKESKGKELYFPPYINDSSEEDDVVRYCYDKNSQLRMIQVERKSYKVNAAYLMDVALFNKLHVTLDSKFCFASYSYSYSILNDESNTFYNIKINPDQSTEQKLTISYDDAGDLKRIYFSSEEDIILYESRRQ